MNSVAKTFIAIVIVLIVASFVTRILAHKNPDKDYSELLARVRTWWVMVAIFSLALLLGKIISIIFFAFLSFLALKEYFSIIPSRRADRRALFWAYLTIPIQYYWIWIEWYGMFIISIPVYAFLLIPFRLVLIGETKGFLKSAATIQWGMMTMVFSISHLGYLLVLPTQGNPNAGGTGLVLFLVTITQLNDVCQYIWGKAFGRNKIIPLVSPNKTWEGFIGGVASSIVLATLLAPILTPLSFIHSILAGALISCFGFVGDVTISALKRDIGIKDSGNILPGHGGILDRIDSLTYTAPLFFHFIHYFYF